MPDVKFSFEPSDIVSRVMSFGSDTPVQVAISGPNLEVNRRYAEQLRARLAQLPVLRDVQFGQPLDYPTVDVALDRERAGLMGIKVEDATRAFVAATGSSRFTTPVFWADPQSGVSYRVQVQIPKTQMESLEEIRNIPVAEVSGHAVLLRNVANVAQGTAVGHYERYNMQRALTLTANIAGADLGSVTRRVARVIEDTGDPPRGVHVSVHGQARALEEVLKGLQNGLLPGMYAKAEIVVECKPVALKIPVAAVTSENSKPFVLKVVDGKTKRVPVTLGLKDETVAEIVAGLTPDDLVVMAGNQALEEGLSVVVEEVE